VLSAGERSRWLSAGECSRWPDFTFFNFPGTVLPFFYFSVVRKVPEKPVLFLPHPIYTALDHNQSHLNTLALTKSLNLEKIGTSHVSKIGILALTIIIDYYCQLYRKRI